MRAPLPRVQLSVMPKGVEHTEKIDEITATISVQLSVMPKGVEHSCSGRRARVTRRCNYQ